MNKIQFLLHMEKFYQLPSISKNIKLAPNSKTFVCTSSTFSYKPQQSNAFLKMRKQGSSGVVLNIISVDYKGKLN